MRKTKEHEKASLPGRILARTLADEILNVPAGGVGPTTVATNGNSDITNQDGDNDGPHVPPPV